MARRLSLLHVIPVAFAAANLLAAGCGSKESSSTATPMATPQGRLSLVPYGKTSDGTVVDLITLRNGNGIEMTVLTYGGIIKTLKTPDKSGALDNIVLGFDDLDSYLTPGKSPYFGCLIGRYGNRIAKGKFTLDGNTYTLAINNDPNSLHGGNRGWDKVVWAADPFQHADGVGVVLTYTSKDGEEGYPGTVKAKVTYTLTEDNRLVIDYEATTDKTTVINLTQHSYFNLSAGKSADILGHELMLNAAQYTPVDATLIPTGEIASVDGTPFDFRTPTAIGARIEAKNEQLTRGKGYDHNWVLTRTGAGLSLAAKVTEPLTGRTMTIETTEPGIQFYSGNFLDPKVNAHPHRGGFCLETQHFPDSPNHPNFPTTTLKPGDVYKTQTVFKF